MKMTRAQLLAWLLTLTLWGGGGVLTARETDAGLHDRVVADVGGIPITLREAVIQASLSRGRLAAVSDGPAIEEALEHLINQTIILEDLKNYLDMSLETLDIEADERRLSEKSGGDAALGALLEALGVGRDELRELLIRRAALREFIRINVKPFVIVTNEDAERYYDEELAPRLVKEAGVAPPFGEVREQVLQIVTETRINQEFKSWLDRHRQDLKIRIIP